MKVELYILPVEKGLVEIECPNCDYLLGHAKKEDLRPINIDGIPMFQCPSCRTQFDFISNDMLIKRK